MHTLSMEQHAIFRSERHAANLANMRFKAIMYFDFVLRQLVRPHKRFVADVALVEPQAIMSSQRVPEYTALCKKLLVTDETAEQFEAAVYTSSVLRQKRGFSERLVAKVAFVPLDTSAHTLRSVRLGALHHQRYRLPEESVLRVLGSGLSLYNSSGSSSREREASCGHTTGHNVIRYLAPTLSNVACISNYLKGAQCSTEVYVTHYRQLAHRLRK